MKGHGSKFGRKKEAAIACLLTHRNIEEAARATGIGTQTLLRWLKLPEFDEEYREARRAAVSQASARLQQGASAAASTLLKVMVDPSTPPATKVRAASKVLMFANHAVESDDFAPRLKEMEQVVKQNGRQRVRGGQFRQEVSDASKSRPTPKSA
jgi:transposase-like protein